MPLLSTVGFAGSVNGGLQYVDGKLIYPVGATLVVRSGANQEQKFLRGHTDDVSAVALSKSGRFLASGQVAAHVQHEAEISVWDVASLSPEHTLRLHKGGVKALAFSHSERYLLSLGSDEQVGLWDLHTGSFLASAPAARDTAGSTHAIAFSSTQDTQFITAGDNTLRVWTVSGLDTQLVKIVPAECAFGAGIRRVITCVAVDDNDANIWCGTTSGDILQVNLASRNYKAHGPDPKKATFHQGIKSIILSGENLVVGSGTGQIGVIKKDKFLVLRMGEVSGGVTSITLGKGDKSYYCGTDQSNIYNITYGAEKGALAATLRSTCHYSKINAVAFAWDYSELFATCSKGGIRVWNAKTSKELLRIEVTEKNEKNVECLCVTISRDGKSIVGGFSDSKIRAFTPQTGKSLYVINDAHPGQVTAISAMPDSGKLITGGSEGQLRIWRIGKSQSMELAVKEHKSKVSAISVREPLLASCSEDGSCVIWNIAESTLTRVKLILSETVLHSVALHPEGHVITVGSDKRITWWDARDGLKLRSFESPTIQNAVAISNDGKLLATAGSDSVVRIWSYESGSLQSEAAGHSAPVLAVGFSPDGRFVVSTGSEAAIMSWVVV